MVVTSLGRGHCLGQNLRTFRIDIVCEKLGIYTRIRGIFLLVETLDKLQRNIGRVGKLLVALNVYLTFMRIF